MEILENLSFFYHFVPGKTLAQNVKDKSMSLISQSNKELSTVSSWRMSNYIQLHFSACNPQALFVLDKITLRKIQKGPGARVTKHEIIDKGFRFLPFLAPVKCSTMHSMSS